MKTIKEIVKYVADYEGLKEEVSVGNIREVVAILSDMMYNESTEPLGGHYLTLTYDALIKNGKRRAKKKKK